MNFRFFGSFACCVIFLLSVSRGLADTFINFDDISGPCNFSQTLHLTNQYAAQGVVFEGVGVKDGFAVLDQCSNFGVTGYSPPSFLAFNKAATLADGGIPQGPETISFTPPVGQVQILAGSSASAGATVSMDAFDSGGNLIASTNIVATGTLAPLAVAVSSIAKVIISSSANDLVMDDLQTSPFIINPPILYGQKSGHVLVLSWSIAGSAGFVLESASALPSASWTQVASAPFQLSGQYVLLVEMSQARSFYRLRRPL